MVNHFGFARDTVVVIVKEYPELVYTLNRIHLKAAFPIEFVANPKYRLSCFCVWIFTYLTVQWFQPIRIYRLKYTF